jgi:DNA-binding transcriptional LysR family regulator
VDRLGAMETFVRVMETGSFSAAAKHLNVSQSAVSKSIAQLEERLGVRLLMRSTHGLRATEAGQTYYVRARRTIEETEEAELAARDARAPDRAIASQRQCNSRRAIPRAAPSHLPGRASQAHDRVRPG